MIMGFVRALLILDVAMVVVVLADGALRHLAWSGLLPFAVILIVAAVPVALPTTFTLASALGSRELADKGVLVTRLAAIEEAASMEVLCSDKTGTITENRLSVDALQVCGSCDEEHLLQAAAAAKAAAGMVLTEPGLENIVSGIQVSRRIHERMLTYTLNKIVKTLQVSIFLSLGFLFFGKFVTTPLLVVLLLLANNFATMSLATDRVGTPPDPQRWTVRSLVLASAGLALPLILLSFGVWFAGSLWLGLRTAQLQTLIFVWLVTSAQATIYSVRERHHFWHSAPSAWLAASTVMDLVAVVVLAWRGWLMTPIGAAALALGFGVAVAFLLLGDAIKGWIFRSAGLAH